MSEWLDIMNVQGSRRRSNTEGGAFDTLALDAHRASMPFHVANRHPAIIAQSHGVFKNSCPEGAYTWLELIRWT